MVVVQAANCQDQVGAKTVLEKLNEQFCCLKSSLVTWPMASMDYLAGPKTLSVGFCKPSFDRLVSRD